MLTRPALRAMAVGCLAALCILGADGKAAAQPFPGTRSLRMDLPSVGQLIVRPAPSTTGEEAVSQLLLEKPGGSLHLLASLETLDFVRLLKGDLNGDQVPEVVAVARHRSGEDEMPWIFGGGSELIRLFPPREEDNPLIGREISIMPTPKGTALAVKVLINVHDFGPPDLFNIEFYRFHAGALAKVGEQILEGTHFNQRLNRAGWALQRGQYLEALSGYQALLGTSAPATPASGGVVVQMPAPAAMPIAARSEALLGAAQCRMFLKDVPGAIAFFDQVTREYAQTPSAEEAAREAGFLRANQPAGEALSLFIDVSHLERVGRARDALALLDLRTPALASGTMDEHLAILRAELLTTLERSDEALAAFRQFLSRFPNSTSRGRVEGILADLEGLPEQDHEE